MNEFCLVIIFKYLGVKGVKLRRYSERGIKIRIFCCIREFDSSREWMKSDIFI